MSKFLDQKEHEAIDESMLTSSISDSSSESAAGSPHEALFFVLAYLPVFELLVISEVCSTLRDAVKEDILPWLNMIVERPLSSRLSDELLIDVTSRADGRLRTLSLINCKRITDSGLLRVVEKNPFISKLHIPACTGLTPDGIIRAAKTLSQLPNTLKILHIDGVYNLRKEHFEMLCSYLDHTNPVCQKPQPILYHDYRTSPSSRNKENGHAIDVEICPRCNEVRMVFDCPKETCNKRNKSRASCRGCKLCIPRCEECGGCVDADEMEYAVCSDILCSNCWLHLPKCNFCNRPYCKSHAFLQLSSPGSIGFLCGVCHEKIRYSDNDVE